MNHPATAGTLTAPEIPKAVSEQVFTDGFPLPPALHNPATIKPRAIRVRRRVNDAATTVVAIAPENGGGVEVTLSDGTTKFGNTQRPVGKLTVHGATPAQVKAFLTIAMEALDKASSALISA